MTEATKSDAAQIRPVVINLFTVSDRLRENLAQALRDHFVVHGWSPATIVGSGTPLAETAAVVRPAAALDAADRRQKSVERALADGARMVIVEEPPVMLAMAATAQNYSQYFTSERALAVLQKNLPSINLMIRTGHHDNNVAEALLENGLRRNDIGFDRITPDVNGIASAAIARVTRVLEARIVQSNPYAEEVAPTP